MEAKHTAGPWKQRGKYIYATGTTDAYSGPVDGLIVVCEETEQKDADGRTWNASGDSLANAAFIVRACNAHDELVNVIHNLLNAPDGDSFAVAAEEARAALAK